SRRWKTLMRLGVILTLITLFSSARLGKLYAPLWQSLSGDTSWESGQFFRGRGLEWFVYLRSYESSGPFHWFFGTGSSAIEGRFLLPLELVKFKPEPHNDYIRILHSYGAVGLLSYLFVLALLIRKALHLLSLEDEFASSLGGITLLILSAVLVESSVDEVLFYPAGAWYLFAIGSAMFCVPRVQGNGPHVAPASSPEETTA
ncbi:MAG TPA: hypothetical protein VFU48_10965, partial [Nitrospira sp.]|nr:hypothetical protein [Nitrospira sp.]